MNKFVAWTKGGVTGSVWLHMMKLLQGTEDTEKINKLRQGNYQVNIEERGFETT